MRKKTILEAQKKTGKVTPDKYKELLQNSLKIDKKLLETYEANNLP
jgi:hypothetical protein